MWLGLLRRDEREPHRLCFAKKAAAFFRMSRSSCRIAILFPEPRQLLALRRRQPASCPCVRSAAPARPNSAATTPSDPRSRADRADRLALVQHQPDGAGLELLSEAAAGFVFRFAVCHAWTSYPPFGRCPRNRIKRGGHTATGGPDDDDESRDAACCWNGSGRGDLRPRRRVEEARGEGSALVLKSSSSGFLAG